MLIDVLVLGMAMILAQPATETPQQELTTGFEFFRSEKEDLSIRSIYEPGADAWAWVIPQHVKYVQAGDAVAITASMAVETDRFSSDQVNSLRLDLVDSTLADKKVLGSFPCRIVRSFPTNSVRAVGVIALPTAPGFLELPLESILYFEDKDTGERTVIGSKKERLEMFLYRGRQIPAGPIYAEAIESLRGVSSAFTGTFKEDALQLHRILSEFGTIDYDPKEGLFSRLIGSRLVSQTSSFLAWQKRLDQMSLNDRGAAVRMKADCVSLSGIFSYYLNLLGHGVQAVTISIGGSASSIAQSFSTLSLAPFGSNVSRTYDFISHTFLVEKSELPMDDRRVFDPTFASAKGAPSTLKKYIEWLVPNPQGSIIPRLQSCVELTFDLLDDR